MNMGVQILPDKLLYPKIRLYSSGEYLYRPRKVLFNTLVRIKRYRSEH